MFTHYFKVGLGIIAVVASTMIGYYSLRGYVYSDKNSYELSVVFDNVQGLSDGNDVWLSGVVIGNIKSISLTPEGQAMVSLRIKEDYHILRGSRFSVNAGPLQDKNLSIEKPEKLPEPLSYYKPGETITDTQSPATLTDLMSEAQRALSQINDILAEVKGVISDDQLQLNLLETTKNIERATSEAYKFTQMLNSTGKANRADIDLIIDNVVKLTEQFNMTAKKVDVLIANANDIVGDEETKKEIKTIVESLGRSMENIEKTTTAIKDLATDKEVEQDLRDTIKSTKSTMENADVAIGGFTKMLRAINDTEFKPDFEFRYESREDLYFADMNVRIFPPNSDVFYMFGFDNLGQDKETNLMFGVGGGKPELYYRFGLKNSELALGFEYDKKELYYYGFLSDPNDLQFDMRIGHKVTKNLYFVAGIEGLFKRDSLSLGIIQRY